MQRVVVEKVADIRNDVRVMQRFENLRIVGQKQTANLFEKEEGGGGCTSCSSSTCFFCSAVKPANCDNFSMG